MYGYYHKSKYKVSSNLGDNFFADAFKKIFPNYNFIFTSYLNEENISKADAIFFGGGSFCYDNININDADFELLKNKKVFYIGVGVEKNIHPRHIECMKIAQLIACRSQDQIDRLVSINKNSFFLPDIVYAFECILNKNKKNKSVLILPNVLVSPQNNSSYWMHASWNYFKSEFSQFLDYLIECKYKVNFFSMCNSPTINDQNAAIEIINMMKYRNDYILHSSIETIAEVMELFSQYETIITQRFHGIVLAEMARTKYIAIHHHDKLKLANPNNGEFISYYGLNKQQLIDSFNNLKEIPNFNYSNIFNDLQVRVDKLI